MNRFKFKKFAFLKSTLLNTIFTQIILLHWINIHIPPMFHEDWYLDPEQWKCLNWANSFWTCCKKKQLYQFLYSNFKELDFPNLSENSEFALLGKSKFIFKSLKILELSEILLWQEIKESSLMFTFLKCYTETWCRWWGKGKFSTLQQTQSFTSSIQYWKWKTYLDKKRSRF